MVKNFNGVRPEIINGIVQFIATYNLRQKSRFHMPPVHTVFNNTESIKFLGPKIWEFVPDEIAQLESLREFRKTIKQWKPRYCPCRICK